jgi:hypothetical protein
MIIPLWFAWFHHPFVAGLPLFRNSVVTHNSFQLLLLFIASFQLLLARTFNDFRLSGFLLIQQCGDTSPLLHQRHCRNRKRPLSEVSSVWEPESDDLLAVFINFGIGIAPTLPYSYKYLGNSETTIDNINV